MKLYQIILAVPDDSDAEDIEVRAGSLKGNISIFSEGFLGCKVIPLQDIIISNIDNIDNIDISTVPDIEDNVSKEINE